MAGSGQFRMGDLEVPGWVGKYGLWGVLGIVGAILALCCCCVLGSLVAFGPMLGITTPLQATPGAGAFGAETPYTPHPVTPWPEGWTPTPSVTPTATEPIATSTPTVPLPPGVTPVGPTPTPGEKGWEPSEGVQYFNAQLLGGSDEIAMMLPHEKDGLETPADRRRDLGWLTSELRKAEIGLLASDETLVAGGEQPYGRRLEIHRSGQDAGGRIRLGCDVWRSDRPDLGHWALDTNWVWHRVKPTN